LREFELVVKPFQKFRRKLFPKRQLVILARWIHLKTVNVYPAALSVIWFRPGEQECLCDLSGIGRAAASLDLKANGVAA
jgi:hypothetical protein